MFEQLFPEFVVSSWFKDDIDRVLNNLEGEYNDLKDLMQSVYRLFDRLDMRMYDMFVTFNHNKKDGVKIVNKYGITLEDIDEVIERAYDDLEEYYTANSALSPAVLYKHRDKWMFNLASIIWKYIPE